MKLSVWHLMYLSSFVNNDWSCILSICVLCSDVVIKVLLLFQCCNCVCFLFTRLEEVSFVIFSHCLRDISLYKYIV